MSNRIKIASILIVQFIFLVAFLQEAFSNVYLVIYATMDGKTGHAGLAIDNYNILIYDIQGSENIYYKYDTVKNGTLCYFDLWPKIDHFKLFQIGKNTEPIYHKLPQATFNENITVASIVNLGIPKVKPIPCDGLICFKTSASQDLKLNKFLDSMIVHSNPFNARKFNCSDFVILGLENILNQKIRAKEFIPFRYSTTPNKLFKKVRNIAGAKIIIDPGEKIKGSFFRERIIKMLRVKKKIDDTKSS